MTEAVSGEALDSLVELARRRGEGLIPLGDAVALARALGIRTRLLCGTDRVKVERFVVLSTSDPSPLVALRRSGERNGELLERREQVDEDEWEYAAEEETLRLALWLELDGGARPTVERMRLASHEFALLDEHGWRDDWADLLAEPRAWVATLLTGVGRVLGVIEAEVDAIDLSTSESRSAAALRAGELLRRDAATITRYGSP